MRWLKELTSRMTRVQPEERVTAKEALKVFYELRAKLSAYDLGGRLDTDSDPPLGRFLLDLAHHVKDAWWTLLPPAQLGPLP